MIDVVDTSARRNQFLELLRQGNITVGFTKTDGTDRLMECTLINIPEEHQPKGEKEVKENDSTLRVFDVEKQGWRSFKLDSVFALYVDGDAIFETVGKPILETA